MFVSVRTLREMVKGASFHVSYAMLVTDPKTYFRNLGFRVFEDDKGELYIMRSAAIFFVHYDERLLENLRNYEPASEYASRIKSTLLSPINLDEALKEITD